MGASIPFDIITYIIYHTVSIKGLIYFAAVILVFLFLVLLLVGSIVIYGWVDWSFRYLKKTIEEYKATKKSGVI